MKKSFKIKNLEEKTSRNNSEIEKIIQQARKGEKNIIKEEKNMAKQAKLEAKRKKVEEKNDGFKKVGEIFKRNSIQDYHGNYRYDVTNCF